MQLFTTYFSTALHVCKHSMALITLKARASQVTIETQLQRALSTPLLTSENRDGLLPVARSLPKRSPLLISLAPDLLDLKIITLPAELSRSEQKKYIGQKLSLTNASLNYREVLLTPPTLFTATLEKQKIRSLVTFLKKCRLTPSAIYTIPLVIQQLLPHAQEPHLFISQHDVHYTIGYVSQNTLQNYFCVESKEIDEIFAAITAQNISPKQIWLGTEPSITTQFSLLIEKKFKFSAKSLFDIPFSSRNTVLSTGLGNAALLAYWGLHGKC
ncbi:MAG: hypothetical protein A3F10_07485 [Coxiella sp. RIFCSPHIGHO2_12_FULL_42_15]|nr:MAG: hypothetical protein A3F10_07485 [Coxiella sp. RIFCSPHIGHO2_12_FULL_42_15]